MVSAVRFSEIQGKRNAFVIYGQPVKMRVLDGDRSRVILERSYNVAALNPNQISTVGKDIVPPKGKTMPFNAEFADLLIAKFQPAALSKPVLERMMLARWYYESSFNGRAGEPDWGRFFVEGKPKPDAAQREKLLPSFKDWTLRRAAATPSVATVVFRYARLQKPGPMKFGTSLAIGASTLSSASDSCRYGTAAKRDPFAWLPQHLPQRPVLRHRHHRASAMPCRIPSRQRNNSGPA